MSDLLPCPLGFTAEALLDLLSLRTNPKLRRELGKCLGQVAAARWPNPSPTDPAWGVTLATLLSSHGGYELFVKAAERHNRGPLEDDHRLNLLCRGIERTMRMRREAGLPKLEGSLGTTVPDLLDAGQTEDAAFVAWFLSMIDHSEAEEVEVLVRKEPSLAAQFGIESHLPLCDTFDEIRRLAGSVAAAATLDIDTLEALGRLASEAATRLRAEEEQNEARRLAVLTRLERSPLALSRVTIPLDASADEIEQALDEAEATAAAFGVKEAEFQAATSRRDYKTAARLAEATATAQEAAETARAALDAFLYGLTPTGEITQSSAASEPGEGDTQPETAGNADHERASTHGTIQVTVTPPDAKAMAEVYTDDAAIAEPGAAMPSAERLVVTQLTLAEPPVDEPDTASFVVEEESEQAAPDPVTEALPCGPGATTFEVSATPASATVEAPAHAATTKDGTTGDGTTKAGTTKEDLCETRHHSPVDAAFWAALSACRPGLASAMLEVGALSQDQAVLRCALHLTVMALVADGSGEVDDRVGEEVEALIQAWSDRGPSGDGVATAYNLVLPAAGLLTILAPGGNASRLPDFLLEKPVLVPQMHALARTLSESGAALGSLWQASGVLASLASEDGRRRALEAHCDIVREWLDRNRDAHLNNYAPARILWSRMLAEEEPLGSMLAVVVRNEVRRGPEVTAMLASFSGQDDLRRLDIEIRGLKLVQKTPISFGAERDLNNLVDEVQSLLRDWTRLAAWSANRRNGAAAAGLKRLREDLLDLLAKAKEELVLRPAAPVAALALRLLQRFIAMLQAGAAPRAAASMDQLLAMDVIAVPSVGLDPAWRMHVPRDTTTLEALVRASQEVVPVEEAIARRVAVREFAGAVLALKLVEDPDSRAALDREIRNSAGIALAETMQSLMRLRSNAEAAEAAGRLPSEQAQPFLREMDSLEESLNQAPPEDIPALVAAFELLELTLRDALAAAERLVRERINARLRGLDLARAATIRTSVERALTEGWLAIAEDFVDRAEAGERIDEPIETPSVAADLDQFFPGRSGALSRWLKGNRAGIGDFIARPDSLPGDIPTADGIASPERSLPLARAWASCGRPGDRDLPRAMAALFTELGFTDPRLEALLQPTATSARFTLRTAPLRDRETTLLPDFGSVANGSYTVLCLWRQLEVNQIRTELQKTGVRAERVIVLFFGVLMNQDRRELAKMARNGHVTSVVVLDQVLALHLALTEQNRLRTFFACALPFSGVKPWSETGAPPPEMFFGRHNERLSIEATSGQLSHLVYGGRQLGKTALLRQIEGAAAGDPHRVVRYVDIKRFGNTVPTEDIWATLADALRPRVPINLDTKGDLAARFCKDVSAWLANRPERSILLLLDEADRFFKKDQANSYRITEELRALSEETQRRFKPVFAGLENVQRMARDPNNPIAQLATPLPIGPLLRGAERREAEALVCWPFTALGFKLAPEVVNRILIFANYYPSLIQLVCQNLLHTLRSKGGAGPPWRVEMSDVEQLLSASDLRRAAFEKFRITLELDQRYFLLALVVAELSQRDSDALAVGIPARDMHDYASMSWPAGFPPDLGEAAFDALADQMVGLGLLRSLDGQRYALRSANLVHLIGSPKTITDQLNAFICRAAPPEPDPLEDRRAIDGAPSLLTTRQEAEIVGTTPGDRIVVCLGLVLGGSGIGGAPRLEKAIREAAKSVHGRRDVRIEMPSLKARTLESFRTEIEALATPRKAPTGLRKASAEARRETSCRLLLVPSGLRWTSEWVTAAQETISRRPPGSAPLRFTFLADARIGWDWVHDGARREQLLAAMSGGLRSVVEIVPGLWNQPSLDVWLELHDPTGVLADWLVNDREVLLRGTGGWDWALRRVCAAGRQGFAKTDAAGLAQRLLAEGTFDNDPLADLRELPEAIRLLAAVEEAEIVRAGDEKVDAKLIAEAGGFDIPPPGLAWAQAVEVVVPGSLGMQLNPLVRAALPLLKAGLP